jgi:hypothetical protein
LSVAAGSGNVAFGGTVGTSLDAATTLSSLTASGAVVDLASVFVDGASSVTGTTRIDLNGATYDSTTAGFAFTGPVSLTAGVSVTTGQGVGDDATFSSTVSGRQSLSVSAGAGDVAFSGTIGTSLDAATTLSSLTVSGAVVDLGSVFVDGASSVTGATRIDLNGTTYDSTTAGFAFTGPVTLTTGVSMTTGQGVGDDVTFSSTVDGAQTLALTAGLGNLTFGGAVGATTALGAVTVNVAADVTLGSTFRSSSLVQAVSGTGDFEVDGALTTTNALTISSATVTLDAALSSTSGDISLTQTSGVLALDVSGGLSAGGNNIDITAPDVAVTGTFGDGSDVTTITAGGNGTIGLGTATGSLRLEAAELQLITAASL